MYKLLIVDDEDFEREGIARLINWTQYGIEMVGTAWNGLDGIEKAKRLRPDIVLTDIKMPVMNGIEMIRTLREDFPEMEFAVLSGYGEYEFTSQAMEQGIRHYILKPCNEDKVIETMEKVKEDVDRKHRAARREDEYLHWAAPQAQKQMFRDLLLDRESAPAEDLFRPQKEDLPQSVRLLLFRSSSPFDGLEEFALENMLEELLASHSQKIFVSTALYQSVALLISDLDIERLAPVVRRVKLELRRLKREPVQAAVSDSGTLLELSRLYLQADELLETGSEFKGESLLHSGVLESKKRKMDRLVDFKLISRTKDYAKLLQSLQVTFLRMQKHCFSLREKQEQADRLLQRLFGRAESLDDQETGQDLMISTAHQIWNHAVGANEENKDEFRYRAILDEIYRHFQDPDFSLQTLASDALYMNKDYIGRFFQKMSGKKFTAFLLEARISAAEQLIHLEPDIMVYSLSEMVGYSADGQYFAKSFKRVTGMTPREYREKVQEEQNGEKG